MGRIVFTKHATEKIGLLRKFGFQISRNDVYNAVRAADRVEGRSGQTFSMKVISEE